MIRLGEGIVQMVATVQRICCPIDRQIISDYKSNINLKIDIELN